MTRTRSFLASVSITFCSMASLFTAGRLFAMLVASASAAASISFKNSVASSSRSFIDFFSFFFFCIRRTAALSAEEAHAPSSPSSSLRDILSSPAPCDFLLPDDCFFIFFSSSESYPSGLSSSKCCSEYSSLRASASSSSVSMKSSSSFVRSTLTESYESPDLYPELSTLPSLSGLDRFFRGSSALPPSLSPSPPPPPLPPARFLANASMRSFMLRVSFLGGPFFAAGFFLFAVLPLLPPPLRFFPNCFFLGPDSSSSLSLSKRPPPSPSESASASGVFFADFFFGAAPSFLRAMGWDLAAAMRSSVSASEEESPKRSFLPSSLAMMNSIYW
mmetsp:Transcript_13231/g.28417  ORF Transcript_13231/g.28417 Transcript_13231/m.28417 type:complete len:332 (+) Transcript_13231:845-1840(+)